MFPSKPVCFRYILRRFGYPSETGGPFHFDPLGEAGGPFRFDYAGEVGGSIRQLYTSIGHASSLLAIILLYRPFLPVIGRFYISTHHLYIYHLENLL